MSREEVLSEYFIFLRNLPDMITSEKQKLIDMVKKEWKIDDLLLNIHKLKFEKKLVNVGMGDNLIDELSIKLFGTLLLANQLFHLHFTAELMLHTSSPAFYQQLPTQVCFSTHSKCITPILGVIIPTKTI